MVVTGDLINNQVVVFRCGMQSLALGGRGAYKLHTIDFRSSPKGHVKVNPPVFRGKLCPNRSEPKSIYPRFFEVNQNV